MPRALSPEELHLVAEEEEVAAAFATPYLGRLRVRTAAGVRDVLLGTHARTAGAAAMVDWRAAPLAAVFFGERAGDDYALEHDGRTLAGTVLRRHLVGFEGDALAWVTVGDVRLRRGTGGWIAEEEEGPLRPRPPERRGRVLSPAHVRLDEVQRGAAELAEDRSLLVLGEAGFGKTTVALRRVAFLARAARAARRPFRGLVVVPTAGLQRLATRMLAELEVTGVKATTFAAWVAAEAWRVFPALPRRLSEAATPAVRRFKRHPAVRSVLPRIVEGTPAMRAVRAGYSDAPETIRDLLLHLFGDRELLAEVVAAAGGGLPSSSAAEVFAHTRVQFTPTSEQALRHVDADRLRTVDGRPIDAGTPLHDAGTIDGEDLAVVFALHRRISGGDATRHGALSRYQHVLLDEAQELAPIELELLGRAVAPGGTVTVAGDERQQVDATTHFAGWPAALAELGQAEAARVSLAVSYRCPPAVEAAARAVLAAAPWPAADEALARRRYGHTAHLVTALGDALVALQAEDPQISVAVVCRHEETAEQLHAWLARVVRVRLVLDGGFSFTPGIDVTCVREVKGLEFDVVVVPDADARTYPDVPEARRALYVAMTRAVHGLWLMAAGAWSPVVAGA